MKDAQQYIRFFPASEPEGKTRKISLRKKRENSINKRKGI